MVNGARIVSRSIPSPKPRSSVSTLPKEGERSCVDTNARREGDEEMDSERHQLIPAALANFAHERSSGRTIERPNVPIDQKPCGANCQRTNERPSNSRGFDR
jgi:hypothetical protein